MKRAILYLFLTLTLVGCSRSTPETVTEDKPDETKQSSLIEMGAEAQKHVGLEIAPAAVEALNEFLEATGTVQPIDSRISHVRPLAHGRLQEVLVKVGDRVAAGQPLARFDNIEAGDLVS